MKTAQTLNTYPVGLKSSCSLCVDVFSTCVSWEQSVRLIRRRLDLVEVCGNDWPDVVSRSSVQPR